MDLDDGQLLHACEEFILGVQPTVVATVEDSLAELLITGSSQLQEFVVRSGGSLADVTPPLNHFKLPEGLSHVEGEDWPGQSLQLCGGSCPGCCRARMGELDMLFHQFEHHLPCWSVWWSLVVTSWGLALQGSRRRHDVDQITH